MLILMSTYLNNKIFEVIKYTILFYNSITQTRIDFLTVVALKFHKHPNDGKNYLKKYSIETNKISLDDTGDFSNHSTQCTNPLLSRALKEVQSCYPLQPIEKVSLISGLIFNVLFMSGWIIYMWALATDIELLIRNYGCVSIKYESLYFSIIKKVFKITENDIHLSDWICMLNFRMSQPFLWIIMPTLLGFLFVLGK